MDKERSGRFCCSARCCLPTCLVLSAVLVVLGGLSYVMINPLVVGVMTNEFVINSPEAVRYADWACKFSILTDGDCAVEHDSVPFYEAYYPFNLTNYDDVLKGAKPKFVELGPYRYQVSITKFNVVFSADGNEVSYAECWTYYWRPELSCETCKEDDLIIGINTGYLGAVATAGSEQVLRIGMTGPTVDDLLGKIQQYYFPYLIANGTTEDSILMACAERAERPSCTRKDAALVQFYFFDSSENNGLFNQRVDAITELEGVFPYVVEYGTWALGLRIEPAKFTFDALDKLLYGDHGIVKDPLNLLDAALLAANNTDELLAKYGITLAQFVSFSAFYLSQLTPTYNDALLRSKTQLLKGGGLFSARTLYEWIFDFKDPLALVLQPGDPQTAIRHNDTSFEDAASYKIGYTIYTGQDDINEIGNVVRWNGTDTIKFWKEPIPVIGNNQDGQFIFQPTNNRGQFPDQFNPFPVFSPDHARTVLLIDSGEWVYTLKGIPTRRFKLANETYETDDFFYQNVNGFVNGSAYHSDPPFRQRFVFTAQVPLFMSQPRFFAADPYYASLVELDKTPSPEECETIVDVEPISGNGMFAVKRLQVNFYVDPKVNFTLLYPNVTKDIFYPSLWVEQKSTISEPLEDEWLAELGLGTTIQFAFFVGGMAVGGFFFILSAVLILRSRSRQAEGYSAIN